MDKLEIKAAIQVQKPILEVFEAIVDPKEMTQYFISRGSGRIETDAVLTWEFPEFDGSFQIKVKDVNAPDFLSFEWESTLVTMTLTSTPENNTVVRITEGSKDNDEAGRKWLMQNTEGWANFLACLKAWVEYKIHLRVGAFDYMQNQT